MRWLGLSGGTDRCDASWTGCVPNVDLTPFASLVVFIITVAALAWLDKWWDDRKVRKAVRRQRRIDQAQHGQRNSAHEIYTRFIRRERR